MFGNYISKKRNQIMLLPYLFNNNEELRIQVDKITNERKITGRNYLTE
jgi:hypothetical protein